MGTALILGEIRDMRERAERANTRLSSEVSDVKTSVAELSTVVIRSQAEAGEIRADVGRLGATLATVEDNVSTLMTDKEVAAASRKSLERNMTFIVLAAASLGALGVILNFLGVVNNPFSPA